MFGVSCGPGGWRGEEATEEEEAFGSLGESAATRWHPAAFVGSVRCSAVLLAAVRPLVPRRLLTEPWGRVQRCTDRRDSNAGGWWGRRRGLEETEREGGAGSPARHRDRVPARRHPQTLPGACGGLRPLKMGKGRVLETMHNMVRTADVRWRFLFLLNTANARTGSGKVGWWWWWGRWGWGWWWRRLEMESTEEQQVGRRGLCGILVAIKSWAGEWVGAHHDSRHAAPLPGRPPTPRHATPRRATPRGVHFIPLAPARPACRGSEATDVAASGPIPASSPSARPRWLYAAPNLSPPPPLRLEPQGRRTG